MKKLFYVPAIVVAIAAAMISTRAQQSSGPWLKDEGRTQFEKLRDSGADALYNLDYQAARKDFSEIARLFPEHPAGPQFLASTLWIETHDACSYFWPHIGHVAVGRRRTLEGVLSGTGSEQLI